MCLSLIYSLSRCLQCVSVLTIEEEGVWTKDSLGSKCELMKGGLNSSSGCSKDIWS